MFNKVVVANRGAVAARVLRALNEMGIASVAVYSEADAGAPYLALASETYAIGPAPARESYLNQDALLEVLRQVGRGRPASGLRISLGERRRSRSASIDAGARFIGPSPRWIDAMGHKTRARELAARYGMPMSQGSGRAAGGARSDPRGGARDRLSGAGQAGGRRRRDRHAAREGRTELLGAVERSRSMASRGFGNAEVYLERLIERPRHVEFQVLGDRTAARRISSSATARRSGATRK